MQPPLLLQNLHHGPPATAHWRAEGHGRAHLFHPAPFQISVAHDSLFRCKRASTQVNDVSIEDLFSQQKKWL